MEIVERKILAIDDDYRNLEVILSILGKDAETILYAPNGKKGCELALKELPDVIIMDWEMPEMNGIEATQFLSSQHETQDIPIIIATGVMISSENLKEALDAGAVDFLRKPFDKVEFLARLNATLRLADSYQEIKYLSEKEKEALEDTIASKERTLNTQSVFNHERDETLQHLSKQLEKVQGLLKQVTETELKTIQKDIKQFLDVDKGWDSFVKSIEGVHPKFFSNLDSQFPTLSETERKLCAFIKMGMDNKEIARLTGIAPGSVRKALTRLKKKLSLEQEISLRNFISNL